MFTFYRLTGLTPYHWITLCLVVGLAAVMPQQTKAAPDDIFPQETPALILTLPDGHIGTDLKNNDLSGATLRQEAKIKTVTLMLNGFTPQAPLKMLGGIPTDKKALSGFLKQHWQSVKDDWLGPVSNEQRLRMIAGDESFTSKPLNEGIGAEPAKMVGITLPLGAKTMIGGGYTWGEKNPALMLRTTEGFMAGVSTSFGKTDVQVSYLTSGQEIMGLEIGGQDVRYDSVMLGTSFRVTKKMGLTATAQYRKDNDPLTTGDNQAIFTVGTKWKF